MPIQVENENFTLKEVYKIFSAYWNAHHRLWIETSESQNYNILLSLNDFLHFCQIDKIIKIKKASAKRKSIYIKNRIESNKLTFDSLEKALRNTNQHKHFALKKKAIICLAKNIKNQKDIFQKISLSANVMFSTVKPDYILIKQENQDRCLLLCNLITGYNGKLLSNLSHVKSLMFCYHQHPRFHDLNQYDCININKAMIIKRKENK